MSQSLKSLISFARKLVRIRPERRREQVRPSAVIRQASTEILEDRALLAAQLISVDMPDRTISPGETFEVAVRYQTLDAEGNADTLQANLIGFNLLFDSSQITHLETPTSGVFQEGAQVLPLTPRSESDGNVQADNDPNTDSALVTAYSDNDPLFNLGWPNNITTNGIVLYTAQFQANAGFTGTSINFTANATGNVVGQSVAFDFEGRSATLSAPTSTIPVASITGGTAVEGDNVTFTVSLDSAATGEVMVDYSTADGTAVAGSDYVSQFDQTLVFAAGETSKTVTVTTVQDTAPEGTETFSVTLGNAVGLSIGTAQATGTITDNDSPSLTISDAAPVEEGNAATFTVTLSAAVTNPITVSYSTQDGIGPNAAVGGSDFAVVSNQSLTFAAGETTQTITVATIDDGDDETTENFSVALSSATGAILADPVGTASITDNDDPVIVPVVSISGTPTIVEGGNLTFTVSLNTAPAANATVQYSTSDGTATAGSDYNANSGTLTFTPGGSLSQTVTVVTLDDAIDEADTETLTVSLSTAVGLTLGTSSANGTITDNDVAGDTGTARIRKFLDANGDGVRTSDEPYLNGWTFELLDSSGAVVAQGTTADVDVNGDTVIDPETETGWVLFDVAAGTYTVREVTQTGFIQTTPSTPEEVTAYTLDQTHDFRSTTNNFDNWGGRGERWILSDSGWFYLTNDGSIFQWDGSPRDNLTGTQVGTLSTAYFEDLTLLDDAEFAEAAELVVESGVASDPFLVGNFDTTQTASISGRKWNDINGDGLRSSDEPWLNGWTIELVDSDGTVVGTTVTAATDLNGDGTIDPVSEAGAYSFENLDAGDYSVREVAQDGWIQTSPFSEDDLDAWELDQELNLRFSRSLFTNWGGLGERWMLGDDNWYYITPEGELFRWNNSPRTNLSGTKVADLQTRYHSDPSLLYNAVDPRATAVDLISGAEVTGINFGNQEDDGNGGGDGGTTDFAGSGDVRVRVVGGSVILNGDSSANGVYITTNDSGQIVISGLGDTTINDATEYVLDQSSITTNLTVSLSGGDDALIIDGLNIGRNLVTNTSTGNDSVIVTNTVVGNNTTLLDLSGDNTIIATDSMLQGNLLVSTGGGEDANYLNGVEIGGNTTFRFRGGDDLFAVQGSTMNGTTNGSSGAGDDNLAVIGLNSFNGQTTVDGLGGNDALSVSSDVSFASDPTVRRIESDSVDTDALLDAIMQRLADAGLDDLLG